VPRKGQGLYFEYLGADGSLDPLSLHGGAPVRGGEKWIVTKWMRERSFPG
jgi:prolyl 4-hydroxylase